MTVRDLWLDFWHALPPFRGRLAVARVVAQHLLSSRHNHTAWAKLPNGFSLKVDLRWQGGYDVLYYFRTYEERLTKLIRRAVDEDRATLIDVGANIGAFCVLAADVLIKRGGHVLAVEPLPQNLEFLCESIAANHLEDLIEVAAVAVGAEEGMLDLTPLRSGEIANARTMVAGDVAGDAIRVPLTTLDRVAHDLENIRFIKADVEGSELFVLRGARDVLRRHRPLVYCEFHREFMATNGTTFAEIESFAESVSYDIRYLGHDGRVTSAPPPSDSRFLDMILVPSSATSRQSEILKEFGGGS